MQTVAKQCRVLPEDAEFRFNYEHSSFGVLACKLSMRSQGIQQKRMPFYKKNVFDEKKLYNDGHF